MLAARLARAKLKLQRRPHVQMQVHAHLVVSGTCFSQGFSPSCIAAVTAAAAAAAPAAAQAL